MKIRVSVLTVSDRCSQGLREDASGRVLRDLIAGNEQLLLSRYAIVPDDKEQIKQTLRQWCESASCDVIMTTGGTGFSRRDVTPEATKEIIEKDAPCIAFALMSMSLKVTPFAMASRLTAGVLSSCLIINFPGSPKACGQCFAVVQPILEHCTSQLRGDVASTECQHKKMSSPQIVISMKSRVEQPALRDRTSPFAMIEVDAAMELIVGEAASLQPSTELLPIGQLRNLIGRTLAVDLVSSVNIPPFAASLKDGYAVQAVDGQGVRRVMSAPSTAGVHPNKLSLISGHCMRISTGAPVPMGADAVVQVEDTQLLSTSEDGNESQILINTKPVFGQDIRVVGADVKKGEVVLREGWTLGPVELGLIASVGFSEVPVVRPPTIGLLSTGDEVIAAGQQASIGKIWDCNKTTLSALLMQRGVEFIDLGIARDDCDTIYNKLVEGFGKDIDVLITTGSVSMGEKDVLKRILEIGFEAKVVFGRVNMKPGKPMSFLTCEWKAVEYMSGRRVSEPILEAHHRSVRAVLRLSKPMALDSRPEFVRGILRQEKEVPEVELIAGSQCSSRLVSVRGANVLICLPQKSDRKSHIHSDEYVTAIFLS